jgi:hypothetical protein
MGSLVYSLGFILPKPIFIKGYPPNPEESGRKDKEARRDTGLRMKDSAKIPGVAQDTLINRELFKVTSSEIVPGIIHFYDNAKDESNVTCPLSAYIHNTPEANSSAKCLKGKTSIPSLVLIAGPRG